MRVIEVELDFETKGVLDLKKSGAWRYAEHPRTDVISLGYAPTGVSTPYIWVPGPGSRGPRDLHKMAADPSVVFIAHNAGFEQAIWAKIMAARYGLPPIPIERWRCSQAAGAFRALPQRLEDVADVLGTRARKDMDGHRTMLRHSKPIPTGKRKGEFDEDFIGLQTVYDYNVQDVVTEREVYHHPKVGPLPAFEQSVWELDQRINQRGVRFDMPLVRATKKVVAAVTLRRTARLRELTNGVVQTGTQRDAIKAWLFDRGLALPDMTADTLKGALLDVGDPVLREVIQLRMQLGTAGDKKLTAIENCICDDGRARGLLHYYAATTGRWGGRMVQPQNFKRPDEEFEKLDINGLAAMVLTADVEMLDMVYGDAMKAIANVMRGTIIPAEGKELGVGDFSSIEARVLAIVAGEEWKIQMFRDGGDPYLVAAEATFGYPCNKKDHPFERQVGKVEELAFGYQGGLGAWRSFENEDVRAKYRKFQKPVPDDETVQGYKEAWRLKHAMTKSFWYDIEKAAIAAVLYRKPYNCRGIEFDMDGEGRLTCRLPSGRLLYYNNPRLVETTTPWGEERLALRYEAMREGRWQTIAAYGGLLTENVVQAISRDLLVHAMFVAEANGFPLILTVHDELIAEIAKGSKTAKELQQIMEDVPAWARGWPVAAQTWTGDRYHK